MDSKQEHSDKTAVITGANGGIGYQAALGLARAGLSVILACRDRARGEDAVKRLKSELPDARVELLSLNLASLASVQEFAEKLSARMERIDVLVNNAAVMAVPQRLVSEDGYELQLATNHLGHFALTSRLFPLLLKSSEARIVTVSSIAHRYGKLDLEDFQSERQYEGWAVYGMTKLANLLFAFELARRVKAQGIPALSLVCHPGVSKTNILTSGPRMGKKVLRTLVSEFFAQQFAQTDAEGALPVIHACLSPTAKNADFYGPDGIFQIRGRPTLVEAAPQARDQSLYEPLWTASEKLTQSSFLIV